MKVYDIDYKKGVQNIREELRKYIRENDIKSLVIGISGGMDSCLCAALARPVCDKLGIPLIGRSLPMSTNKPEEIERAERTGKAFCTDFLTENLEEYFNVMTKMNKEPVSGYISGDRLHYVMKKYAIRNGNIKARIRMIYLYNLASENNGMVLSTDNFTELMLGFWTLHGDVGDYGMIQQIYKTEVYDMAEWLAENEFEKSPELQSILMDTVNALATDGLGVSSMGDLGQILPEFVGSSREGYKEVDRVLRVWLTRKGLHYNQEKIVEEAYKEHTVIERMFRTEYKRNNPTNIDRDDIFRYNNLK